MSNYISDYLKENKHIGASNGIKASELLSALGRDTSNDSIRRLKAEIRRFMSNYEPQMYFDYTYHGGYVSDISLDRHSVSLDGDSLVVDDIGNVENLQRKIKNYFC